MTTTKEIIYDSKADAALFAESLRSWAKLGFWRGFAGVRSEIIPGGKITLPSVAFHKKATEILELNSPDAEELKRREYYIDEVMAMLSLHQQHYIDQHYKRSILGHIVDVIVGLVMVALMGGLFYTYGPFHPVPLSLVGLMGVKLIFLFVSVRRMIKIAQNTFTSKAAMIRIPWDAETPDQAKA
ncbi:hypothetical protein [Rhizobium sp. MHM7A]|uniref:hypothetical protein n=1 Tax=Rhizobium sp. MHM7A TaxID=2583233 RepID=UPI001106848D|nr:hypothetical protein [Rhizobium sp. MHM7A]TLX16637.1 hypothetical protein FFR93_04660 [Rhizobium sp. MHM7A]